MKFLLSISMFCCTIFLCNAQTSLGLKAGICIPNLKGSNSAENPIANDWSSRLGPYSGVVMSVKLSEHFSLQPELNFSSQGGKKKGKQAIATASIPGVPPGISLPPYLYLNMDATAILNYLELPVLASGNFRLSKKLDFFINAGPYVGYLLNAKTKSKGSSIIYTDEAETTPLSSTAVNLDMTMDIKDDLKKMNMGIQFGTGISYKLTNGSVRLTGGGNLGLTNIQKDKSNGENKTGAATITIGYLHNL